MIKREVVKTNDGSMTIFLPDVQESYHSRHGAVQEALHVYIDKGLCFVEKEHVSVLELGFGTGLNALLTMIHADRLGKDVRYVTHEAYPLDLSIIKLMNFERILPNHFAPSIIDQLHTSDWEKDCDLTPSFKIRKCRSLFESISYKSMFDLIYYDVFGFRVQPELWTFELFTKMYQALNDNGVLVTYACRSIIKENLIKAGFQVEKLKGPPGKREMLRAVKVL